LSIVEEERVKQSINYFESEIAHNKTKKTLENLYETQKTMKYELKSSQELIQQKELHINSIKDQLNQTENKLKSSQELIQQKESQFYEMEYLSGKKRPIIQRLISRFHTLYILFNINETGFKNALINIKGYSAIKKIIYWT